MICIEVFISRNAIFFESIFPCAPHHTTAHSSTQTLIDSSSSTDSIFLFDMPTSSSNDLSTTPQEAFQATDLPESSNAVNSDNEAINSSNIDSTQQTLRRSDRAKKLATFLADFHCNSALTTAHSDSQAKYPLSSVLSYHNISCKHLHFILTISSHTEPSTYKQAIKHQHWITAMNSEIDALNHNSTWTFIDLPIGKTP